MDTLRIRNWDKWQSYRKDRGQPPWIKIHREVMRHPEWVELTDAQRGQLVAMWLLAADRNGVIPASPVTLRKLCFMESEPDIKVFMDHGFVETTPGGGQDDATMASRRRQDDAPEAEAEAEESREEGRAGALAGVVFQGSYVKKVQEKDLSGWLDRYSTLSRSEMLAEIALCDEYHSGSESPPPKWFFTLSAWLKRVHDGRLKAKRDADEAERRIYAGVL